MSVSALVLPEHPQSEFAISGKGPVLGYESQFMGNGLPDNQAVKWVFMFHAGQVVRGRSIGRGNRQYVKPD